MSNGEWTKIIGLVVKSGGRARGYGDIKDKGVVCSN